MITDVGDVGGVGGVGISDPLEIRPARSPFDVTIPPPGSKSQTNRAILLASLACGQSRLRGALLGADDSERMLEAVGRLGAGVTR